jgi:beta-fructofuranosidase
MDKVLFEDNAKIGIMWECPNFFPLPDYSAPSGPADSGVSTYVLIASPMDMELEDAEGSIRFPKGNNVCYMVGDFDEETEEFTPHQSASHEKRYRNQSEVYATYHPVDCGLDFYAPQVMKAPDGRTIMIGWMQDPSTSNLHNDEDFRIFGQMSIPRELRLRKGRLLQRPVREIESYRTGRFICASVELDSETRTIDGISGRTLDMEIEISPKSWSDAVMCSLDEFSLRFARDYEHYVELSYRPDSSVVTIDRSMSGQNEEMTKRRSIRVRERRGTISLRILIDRYSAEVFINGGEQVMSATYYTPLEAEGITFSAEGSAIVDISAYQLGRKGE